MLLAQLMADITLIEYDDQYSRDTAAMWRASKEKALGVQTIHSVDNHLDFLRTKLVKSNTVYLAIDQRSDLVVGIMAIHGTELNQLYIHVDYQRIGIGTRMLNLAKKLSPGKLQLYTFEVNSGAQAFYEQHGFVIIGRGHENQEGLSDIRYEWTDSGPSAT